jgi:Protein of unknown function (DUF3592)
VKYLRRMSKLARVDSFFHYFYFFAFIVSPFMLLWGTWERFPLVDYRFGIGLSKAEGVILESRVDNVTVPLRGSDGRAWRANIRYRYNVNGVTYESDRIAVIRPIRVFSSSGQANNLVYEDNLHLKYRVGRTVPVYYNPQNPSFALLERGYPLSRIVMNLVSIGLLAVGSGFLLRHYRTRRKELAPKRIVPQNLKDLQ